MSGKVVNIETEDEYKKALAETKGPVALEFTMEGCEACDEEKPRVEKLAERCAGLTVLRVDVDKVPALADVFGCQETPTLYYAKSPEKLEPKKALELKDSSALARKLKCARKKD